VRVITSRGFRENSPTMGGLASHYHERLNYTKGMKMCGGMERKRVWR